MQNKLAIFEDKKIRKVWNNDEWWFVVEDIVGALTESRDPKQYIKRLRKRDFNLEMNWGTICTPLEMIARD
jgi:prophage antirepressor-like protein